MSEILLIILNQLNSSVFVLLVILIAMLFGFYKIGEWLRMSLLIS